MFSIRKYLSFYLALIQLVFLNLNDFHAQTGNYFVQNFLPKTYQAHANNQGITQDTIGAIYVANNNGVLIYDGINWDICKRADEVSVWSIAKTSEGEIVIGTEDGDIAVIAKDKIGNYFYKSLFNSTNQSNKQADVVRQIICIENSTFFLSSDRLVEYKNGQLKFYRPINKFHTRAWVFGNHLFVTEIDHHISVLLNGKFEAIQGTQELSSEKSFFSYPLGSGRYALGYRNPGIVLAFYDSIHPNRTRFVRKESTCDPVLISSGINNGCLMNNGHFLVSTNTIGAFELDTSLNIVRRYTTKNGIYDNNVKGAFEDSNGNIWLPLYYGISFIETNSPLFQYTRNDGIAGLVQCAVNFEDRLYIATDKGVQYFDNILDKFVDFQNFDKQSWTLKVYQNKLFIGADKGFFVYSNNALQQISDHKTLCFFNDPAQPKLLYVGTDQGVESYWIKEGKYEFIQTQLSEYEVTSIAGDENKNIYFAVGNNGIYFLNYAKGNVMDSIQAKNGLPKQIFETYVFSYKNRLLLGTDTGIYKIIKSSSSNFKCVKDPELYFLTKNSQVYRATQFGNGIVCYQKYVNFEKNKSEEKIVYLTEDLTTQKFKASFLSHLSDITSNQLIHDSIRHLVYISANEGLFIVAQNSLKKQKEYKLLIKSIVSKNDTLLANAYSGHAQAPYEFTIPFDKNDVSITLGFTSFETPGIEFSYKLEGRDSEFSKWNKRNTIVLSNLFEGEYHLIVKARTDLNDTENLLKLSFTIRPPWYRSIYAYIVYILLFLSFVYGIVKLNSKRLIEDNRKLEKTIEERTSTISHQKEEIEHKQKEILDSINYAQRIQRALLASKKLLDKNLPDYFVFFQPKDVVSGDFYWAAELKNKHFALVTADSTGHGVPGAIMSMLNISCLKEAVESEKLISAKDILNHTRKKVIETLANDGSESGGKDGMDCSLLCLDLKNNLFTYAAANNPVWVIRMSGDTKEKELIELSPDKMPVGKHDRDSVSFNEHLFELQKDDVIYTLTDGLPDQFGGPKGKKFMYKQLKELLLSISNLSMSDQKAKIHEALEAWRGYNEQVDDICLIGVRV